MGDSIADRLKVGMGRLKKSGDGIEQVVEIPVDKIMPNRFQPRVHFDDASLRELAANIRERGVIQPIIVRPVDNESLGHPFEIVAGERRWRASRLAGLATIRAIVRDVSDEDSSTDAIIENVQRRDLNVYEKMRGYALLRDRFGNAAAVAKKTSGDERTIQKLISAYDSIGTLPQIMNIVKAQAPKKLDFATVFELASLMPKIEKLQTSDKREFRRIVDRFSKKGLKDAVPKLKKKFSKKGKAKKIEGPYLNYRASSSSTASNTKSAFLFN